MKLNNNTNLINLILIKHSDTGVTLLLVAVHGLNGYVTILYYILLNLNMAHGCLI